MLFYFALSSSAVLPQVQALIEPMLDVGEAEAVDAVHIIKGIIESAMRAGEVLSDNFHQVVALFALVKICRDQSPSGDTLVSMSDELGVPVRFDRDEDWRSYLVKQNVIPEDRMDEAQDLFVAYGAMSPILDLSTLAQATTVGMDDFCL